MIDGQVPARPAPERCHAPRRGPGRGVEAYDARNTDRTWDVIEVLAAIAADHGRPMGQVAIAWLLRRPGVASVLLGARTAEQLAGNLSAVDLDLSAEEIDRLTAVSAPGLAPYPYGTIEEFCDVAVWRDLGIMAVTPPS